jgi:hypothetical protein
VLPAASFTVPGYVAALAASGARVGVATLSDSCVIRVAELARATTPTTVKTSALPCSRAQDGSDANVEDLWLGKTTAAATVVDSPSPHGESYTLWTGPLPQGPLRRVGSEWSWTDSDRPPSFGCARAVAAGGGVIAETTVPNRLGVEQGLESRPACRGGATTKITLTGAARAQTVVGGSWTVLATDGKFLALARLDDQGVQTGELSLVGLDGKLVGMPQTDANAAKQATGGWLTPDGLILRTRTQISAPDWTIRGVTDATVAEGRLLYVQGRVLRVRRLRDGVDRPLRVLPRKGALVATGAFGLAVAVDNGRRTSVYRLPWHLIDATLPAR